MTPMRIPRDLDGLPNILVWEADEFVILMFVLAMGFGSGDGVLVLLGTIVAALGLAHLYRRLKENFPVAYVAGWLYWIGVQMPMTPRCGRDRLFLGDG